MLKIKNADVLLTVPVRPENYYAVPSLGLGYLASAVRRAGHSVSLLDCAKEGLGAAGFANTLAALQPRIIGIQFHSSDYPAITEMLPLVRRALPGAVVVLGGAHPTSDPENVLAEFPLADYAFRGEAEQGFSILVSRVMGKGAVPLDSIPGLIHREAQGTVVNKGVLEEDLDALGFPAWDLMDPRTYGYAPQAAFSRHFPLAPISTMRGCPCHCSFCTVPEISGRKLRKRSVGHVIEEIKLLKRNFGVREIHIIDDAFTSDRTRVMAFCDALIKEKLSISFTFPNGVRLDTLDREMLLRMKGAGLEFFSVGVESGSDRILKDMHKGLTRALIEEKLSLVREAGLEVNAFFILGYPGETREDILSTIAFSKQLPIRRAQFSLFKAYPGTPLSKRLLETGRITGFNYKAFSFHKVDVVPDGMTADELKALQRKAFLTFYLRPGVLFAILKEIRSWRHLKFIIKRIFASLFVSG